MDPDTDTGDLTVTTRCRYRQLRGDWNTPPLKVALLPPELALAA